MQRWLMTAAAALAAVILIGLAMHPRAARATDPTYSAKVHGEGPDILTVESGGLLQAESGGTITAKSGSATNLNGATTVGSTGSMAITTGAPLTLPVTTINTSTTLTAAQSGQIIIASVSDLVVTLPASAAGLEYTLTQNVTNGSTGLKVSPAAGEKLVGGGIVTPTSSKGLIDTAATSKPGDAVRLRAIGAKMWMISSISGTWAREP